MNYLEKLIDTYPDEEFLYPTGFEDAVVGAIVDDEREKPTRVILSIRKCIEILCLDMTYTEAVEYFEFNIIGAYVGEKTPLWLDDEFECSNKIIDYFNDNDDDE
jgi:hypothetical protein